MLLVLPLDFGFEGSPLPLGDNALLDTCDDTLSVDLPLPLIGRLIGAGRLTLVSSSDDVAELLFKAAAEELYDWPFSLGGVERASFLICELLLVEGVLTEAFTSSSNLASLNLLWGFIGEVAELFDKFWA